MIMRNRVVFPSVGTNDANDASRRQLERQVFYEELLAKGFAQAACLDDLVAETDS